MRRSYRGFVQEDGTGRVHRLTRRSSSTVLDLARITTVEVTSAVARRRKGRTLTSRQVSSILYPTREPPGNSAAK
jgi:hypothetical protein